ncbi:uncharacterized protein LOC110647484 [Hevea brasiliensis]|uniref:uncharacterized protein LOC110647484 n=1 Tax=Hevea brasiliensis TaxID=3981 RepID=UPI0025FFDBAE|nr:uncharacterized protein LOC110647484 [Hevea brasiliensis]
MVGYLEMEGLSKNKILFWWLAANGGLFTYTERVRRNLSVDCIFPICREKHKSVMHVLRDCDMAALVWRRLDPSGEFGMACWAVWRYKNRVVFNEECCSAENWIQFIGYQAHDFAANKDSVLGLSGVIPKSVSLWTSWNPPPESWFKLNIDGAQVHESGNASCGGLIRVSYSKWARRCMVRLGKHSITIAET